MLYLGDAGQVHQGEVDNVGGIYLQVDRLVADALRRREMYTFVNSVGTQYIPHAHTRQNGVFVPINIASVSINVRVGKRQ